MNLKKQLSLYGAEFIGTFFLVFFGCGAVILSEQGNFNSHFIPVVFGGTVMVMIYAVGHISGAHFNPAVTLAFCASRKFPASRALGYIGAQTGAAVIASLMHLFIWGEGHSFGVTGIQTGMVAGLWVEFLLSFALMFVIISVATDARAIGEMAGMAIGATVGLCAFIGGPLTGASMNPARSIGPALVSGEFSNLWIYIFIPPLGAIVGALIYEKIKCHSPDDSEFGCC